MNTDDTATPQDSSPALTPDTAVHLLEVGLTGPLRPVDRVIKRLHEADGEQWFTRAVAEAAEVTGCDVARLPEEAPSLDDLEDMKERAKAAGADASTVEEALCATLAYLVCVAAALAHHGRTITSRSRAEMDRILVDLADAVPARWRTMLLRAVLTCDQTL